jgi:8-oxo-dGTP pyrophosphatase MutT (NUDIX family)
MTGNGPTERVEEIERQEFARGHISSGEQPVDPRAAATIVLAREAARGPKSGSAVGAFEVLLLRRPDTARFAAGAYVFPGGVVDEADGDAAWEGILHPDHTLTERPALVAALRELFEETGLLPADGLAGSTPQTGSALARARARLLANEAEFSEIVTELGLTFRELDLVYFSRWITPRQLTRRYDTRFFLAVDPGAEPELTDEHTAYEWLSPRVALEGLRTGELPMLYPTWKTLETLAGFETLEAALGSLRVGPIEPILAKLEVRGDRFLPLMPGDLGYEEAP